MISSVIFTYKKIYIFNDGFYMFHIDFHVTQECCFCASVQFSTRLKSDDLMSLIVVFNGAVIPKIT